MKTEATVNTVTIFKIEFYCYNYFVNLHFPEVRFTDKIELIFYPVDFCNFVMKYELNPTCEV